MNAQMSSSGRTLPGRRKDGSSIRVCLIDDEDLLRSTLRRLLELDGFTVRDFGSGASALSVLPEFDPSVVVTDVRMPDMDGTQVLAAIKGLNPAVGVLLLTGHLDPQLSQELRSRGAYGVLVKPVASSQLEGLIRQAAGEAA